jgi:hypothetical protein
MLAKSMALPSIVLFYAIYILRLRLIHDASQQ